MRPQLDFGQMFSNKRNSEQSGSRVTTPCNGDLSGGVKDTARFEEDVSDLQMFLTKHG